MARPAANRTKEELTTELLIQLEFTTAKIDAARYAVQKAMKVLRALNKPNPVV